MREPHASTQESKAYSEKKSRVNVQEVCEQENSQVRDSKVQLFVISCQ